MKSISTAIAIALVSAAFAAAAPKAETNPVPKASAAAEFKARVVYFEGDVTVNGVPAEIGMELGIKASFKTGPDSSCDLVYNEKNAIRVGKNTIATIDFSKAATEIELEKGGMTSVLRKLEKVTGGDSFRIKMKGAVAGVRGTAFCVWETGNGSYVCACNGTVHTIDAKGGNEFSLTSAHHVAKMYTAAGDSITAAAAEVLFHTDALVESVAARIGEKIDWNVPD